MKVLLFSEENTFSKSGVGQALNHQKEALGANNVQITLDANDEYDIVHINTIGLEVLEGIKKGEEKGEQTRNLPYAYDL